MSLLSTAAIIVITTCSPFNISGQECSMDIEVTNPWICGMTRQTAPAIETLMQLEIAADEGDNIPAGLKREDLASVVVQCLPIWVPYEAQ